MATGATSNAVLAKSQGLARTRAAPRLHAQLPLGPQLPSTQGPRPRLTINKDGLASILKQTQASNRVAARREAKEQAAAASRAAELAQQAATRQLAPNEDSPMPSSSSSCQPQAWQRPRRDPNAPHPAQFLMHPTGCPDEPKPQPLQHSLRTTRSRAPQQRPSPPSSCQTPVPLTRQTASSSAPSHPSASCDTKAERPAPAQATQNSQRQPLHQAEPTSTTCSRQPPQQHSQNSTAQAHAQQQQPVSLGDKVAAKFAVYVPPSVQRRAVATPAHSLGAKLAAKFAAFQNMPTRQARLAAAA